MAIGTIEALQAMGFNNDNESITIPVVGIDASPEAQELIAKGVMTGTVFQDFVAKAEALYHISMNMVADKKPLEGTNYVFDETGVSIRIPYKEYIKN